MRCVAFTCDVTSENLTDTVRHNSVDFVTLIFVLSSIAPEKMSGVLKNIYNVSLHIQKIIIIITWTNTNRRY